VFCHIGISYFRYRIVMIFRLEKFSAIFFFYSLTLLIMLLQTSIVHFVVLHIGISYFRYRIMMIFRLENFSAIFSLL